MIGRIALRLATLEVLYGKTSVGTNVLDSNISALDIDASGILDTDQEGPFIAVYTDDARLEGALDARALHRSGPTDLVIEIGVAASMLYRNETGTMEVVPGIPDSDAAYEFLLDVIGREIVNALSDPGDAWAEIWRNLSSRIIKIERKRTAAATGGRIAAHQLILTLDLLPDPVFGEAIAPNSAWAKFFAKASEVTGPKETATKVAVMKALIGDAGGTEAHELQRRRYGLTIAEARAMLDTSVQPEV